MSNNKIMGLFSRKKKLTKEQRKENEKAREELQKLREQQKQAEKQELTKLENARKGNSEANPRFTTYAEENPEEYQKLQKQIEKSDKEFEQIRTERQKEFNKSASELRTSTSVQKDTQPNQQQTATCSVSDCSKEVDFFAGKKCKFCENPYCFEHIQLEKHECVKPTLAQNHLRKTWLRKFDVNISSGRYIVVCDECGYVSKYGSLMDMAGGEREEHLANNSCDLKKVWLEEDLSDEKVEKNMDLETVVPTDRTFWVCAHCRPPQKFTDRSEYISHHYFHS